MAWAWWLMGILLAGFAALVMVEAKRGSTKGSSLLVFLFGLGLFAFYLWGSLVANLGPLWDRFNVGAILFVALGRIIAQRHLTRRTNA